MMNETSLMVLLSILFIAVLLLQHFRFKKYYVGYKDIQDAIQQESSKLTSLKQEIKAGFELVEDGEVKLAEAIKQKNEVQVSLGKLQSAHAELERVTLRVRSQSVEAKNELAFVKADLITYQASSKDFSATLLRLAQEKTSLETRIAHLIELELRELTIQADLEALVKKFERENFLFDEAQRKQMAELQSIERKLVSSKSELAKLMGRIDLYSRVDEYTRVGHFEMPNYLYETTVRYQSEIKEIRDRQRKLIRERRAITCPENLVLSNNKALDKKILDGQVQLMLGAFNIECDLIIEKVNPANLDRTLEQIEKKAEVLEKNCATLKCGFNIDYVELKFEECKLQFEYALKRRDEQEEQRIIREQMREEVRVQKQYEEALKEAEREEQKFIRLLENARLHLAQDSEIERSLSLAKIHLLEEQLKEAQERSVRAKSMAEQTRRGFVYVISNIGAFGEGIYKIGLTRRLDPQERVDELSSASVPFRFDVHAMCFSEDAPALEYALHKRFSHRRVNAVNFKKEFFRVELNEIQAALEEIVNEDVEFFLTPKAEDYFQSKRLMPA